jgi:hypothetical protein
VPFLAQEAHSASRVGVRDSLAASASCEYPSAEAGFLREIRRGAPREEMTPPWRPTLWCGARRHRSSRDRHVHDGWVGKSWEDVGHDHLANHWARADGWREGRTECDET